MKTIETIGAKNRRIAEKDAIETGKTCPSKYRSIDLIAFMGEIELGLDFQADLSWLRPFLPAEPQKEDGLFFQEALSEASYYESNRDPWELLMQGWYGSSKPEFYGIRLAEEHLLSFE